MGAIHEGSQSKFIAWLMAQFGLSNEDRVSEFTLHAPADGPVKLKVTYIAREPEEATTRYFKLTFEEASAAD